MALPWMASGAGRFTLAVCGIELGPSNRVRNRFEPPRRSQLYVGELGVGVSKRRRGVYILMATIAARKGAARPFK